jgi:hypothetical protein
VYVVSGLGKKPLHLPTFVIASQVFEKSSKSVPFENPYNYPLLVCLFVTELLLFY